MGSHKLIEFYDDWHVELYDLAKDVGEEHDLAASLPGRAEELRRDLARWRKAIGAQMPVVKTAR